ncbi:MAG: GGDEF domain-containing protein [Treponema sp.]|nr:GGDEF domain-containing protein [Treponema sp.]
MDVFFKDNKVEIDSVTEAYSGETLTSYAAYLLNQNIPFSYVLLDVDNFTYITDAFGSAGGNKVLYDIAKTIKSVIGERGVLARNSGDEFSILLKNVVTYDEAWDICHTILVKINEIELPEIGKQTLTVTIGLARYPENAADFSELHLCAEKALYRGKTKGRNCFIIYLAEKHANIIPKSEKQRMLGSMNLHSNVFKFLTSNDDLRMGIMNLFNFISSYFQVDHICIQTSDKIIFQKIHQLSKNRKFRHIPHNIIYNSMNQLTGVLYIGDTKNLQRAKHIELYEQCCEQEISASCICEISYRDEVFGLLRADMTGTESDSRRWQYSDMDLLLTAAKTIAMILHYTGKNFETL